MIYTVKVIYSTDYYMYRNDDIYHAWLTYARVRGFFKELP